MVRGFVFSAAFLLLGVFAPAAIAAPGFKLKQTSDFYGDSIAEVSKQSLGLTSSRLGLRLHVAAPTFAMMAINDKNKQYASLTLERWGSFVADTSGGAKLSQKKEHYVKVGSVKICGMLADEYLVQCRLRPNVAAKDKRELWRGGESFNTRYWVMKQISPPQEAYEMFSNALGMPSELGMPVRMIQYNRDGQPFTTFDTQKIEKCEVKNQLAAPTGYIRAADEMSLLIAGADGGSNLSALLDDTNLGEQLGEGAAPNPIKNNHKGRVRGWVPGMEVESDVATASRTAPRKVERGTWIPGS